MAGGVVAGALLPEAGEGVGAVPGCWAQTLSGLIVTASNIINSNLFIIILSIIILFITALFIINLSAVIINNGLSIASLCNQLRPFLRGEAVTDGEILFLSEVQTDDVRAG